jgi:hypothetical protein
MYFILIEILKNALFLLPLYFESNFEKCCPRLPGAPNQLGHCLPYTTPPLPYFHPRAPTSTSPVWVSSCGFCSHELTHTPTAPYHAVSCYTPSMRTRVPSFGQTFLNNKVLAADGDRLARGRDGALRPHRPCVLEGVRKRRRLGREGTECSTHSTQIYHSTRNCRLSGGRAP